MKKVSLLLVTIFLIAINFTTQAQITGTIFRDYNNNGTRETVNPNEPLATGIIVNAYNASDALVATTTSAGTAAPNYSFPSTGANSIADGLAVRLEFIVPVAFGAGESSVNGATSSTSVRFVTAGAAAININFGVFNKNEFFQDNPKVIVPRYLRGTVAPLSTTDVVLNSFQYVYGQEKDGSTTAPAGTWTTSFQPPAGYRPDPTAEATQSQVGTIYGLGWKSTTKTLYMGSYLRRKTPLGPSGLGAIYFINNPVANTVTNNPQVYVNLNTLFANAPAGTLGFTRETNAAYDWNDDNAAKPLIGKRGLGDIEVNNKQDTLYTIGLNDRKLYAVPTSGTLSTTTIKSYDFISSIIALTGVAGAQFANSEIHPFAIGINPRDNFVYVGGVYGDDGNAGVSANLRMLIWRFDPSNGTATLVLNQFLGYGRSGNYGFGYGAAAINIPATAPAGGAAVYQPWNDNFTESITAGSETPTQLYQPMLTDIAFDGDAMVIGFRDRFGDQTPIAGLALPGNAPYSRGSGEIIRAHNAAGTWTLEAAGVSRDGNTGANITGSTVANTGPGSGEFYSQEWAADGDNAEASMGALLMIPGKEHVMSTAFDPSKVNQNNQLVFGNVNNNGVQTHSNINGLNIGAYEVFNQAEGSAANGMAKTNGLGDLVALIDAAPIEIGNRVWNDANGDGIQNPGEVGIGGVALQIFVDNNNDGVADGVAIGTTTTSAAGDWYFNNGNITGDADPNTTGTQATLTTGVRYIVRPAAAAWTAGAGAGVLAGLQLTKTDKIGNGTVDLSDNDATLIGATPIPQISVLIGEAGQNNHTLDFGFKALASIGDKVWLDNGAGGGTTNNGTQDGTEPGVAGVTVSLLNNAGVVIATTVTDGFGNYLFDNLVAGTYSVRVTPPSNHSFTTQTNTIDDANTTGVGATAASQTGSDVNVTTGQSYPVVLSAGENNRNIDAGLIFNTPTATNSIGDRIWFDNGLGGGTAGNGVQDGTEPGVAGVTVTLYAADGVTVIATTVTDANGNYIFTNLPATTNYIIGVTPPAGTIFTTTTGTTTANGNSDVNATLGSATYGKTTVISTGVAGTQVTGVDAGIVSQALNTASLGNRVWNDLNNDGTQDAGEPSIAGVTVNLYEDVNGDGVLTGAELTAVRTAVTDAFGNYIFNNLVVTATNKWQVEFVQPAGYTNTAVANNNSGADETDSDITNGVTDRTDFIRLKADDRNTSVDAGFVLTAPAGTLKLGDKVWRDDNANGQQDGTESGVAGVTVKLYQNGVDGLPGTADDVLVATKTTDINGNYLFTNLAASTTAATNYNVQFSNIPANFSFTSQNTGVTATDNNANSLGKTGSINLLADDLTIDAGIKQGVASGLGSLGNRVWYDLNGNGLQDGVETGVANVTVSLYKDANNDGVISGAELTAIATTTTNTLGEYMFTNLVEGSYQVGFNLPAALSTYALTIKDAGADDAIDSDGNLKNTSIAGNTAAAQTSFTNLIALATGEDNTTVDLGIIPAVSTNTIGNKVWWDQNANGTQDATEPGVVGVVVKLYNDGTNNIAGDADDVLVGTTTSDINGNYLFVGLADDTYYANFSNVPAGFDFTTKEATNVAATDVAGSDADRVSGTTGTVQLLNASGLTFKDNRSLDAGIVSTRAVLGNKIFDDLNGDGIQNIGEPGVAGVQVILYAADGTTVLSSTITDATGNYLFANLTAGTYVVGVNAATIPVGMQFTAQDNTTGPDGDGVNTATGGGDSDVSPATGKTAAIVLAAGQANLTVDAGIRRTPVATVGNRVWDDANGNGLQDAGEVGIPGVIATLYNNAGVAIGSAVTDANGNWLINNVAVGTGYYVIFTNKPKGNFTIQDNGGVGTGGATDTDTDSDVNASGQTGTFDVTANTINVKIDAGIVKGLASLGNKVWLDNGVGGGVANDGVQNGTEPGVAGVAVSLYVNGADGLPGTNDDVLVGATITDAYGNYLFENLVASSGATTQYNVRVTPPANYTFTTQTNTTDDNNTTGASTTGSDVNVLGVSYSIDLSAGENNPNIDAGLIFNTPTATNSIGDKVWYDANGDGVNANSATEPGVAGVTVTLYDAATGNVVAITTTDANGNYIFSNLPANTNYQVGFSAPGGTVLTTGGVLDLNNASTNSDPSPTTGLTSTINTSSAGTQITGVDAGLKNDVKGALGDFVWNDINNNGIQDAGEPGIPGVTMQLYSTGADNVPGGVGANADLLIGTVTTDANGYYIFPNLDPAKYFVVATPVTGYSISAKDVANPAGNTKDNDFGVGIAPYAGKYVSSVFTLLPTSGGVTRDMTVDLGIHNNAAINTLNTLGDKVWNDVNKDGLQTAGEAGVANVTARLLTSAGAAVNNPATGKPYVVMTDANGNYKFVDLVDGDYIVEFANIPAGYSFTGLDASGSGAPGSGTDGTNDSDAKMTTGITGVISVDVLSASATSVNIITVDAGISQGIAAGTASLGNRVWYDVNNNGLQDATELGVGNVKVELLDALGATVNVSGTATPYVVYTNALGEYLFTGLAAGDYTVRFSRLPAGYTSSTANTGTDDLIDADASFAGASVTATTTATTAVYTLQTGEDNLTVDMGIVPAVGTNSVGNFVWNDTNVDGLQTAGEPGVPGVTVSLYTNGADGLPGTADDVLVAVTTTDNAGAYIFVGLADGNYNIGVGNLPTGAKLTTQTIGTTTGSDADAASGRTGTIALDPTSISAVGINNVDIDAGITTTTAALGNYVWLDTNGDGVQDATEKGVSGVTVLLYDATGTTVLASIITDANGKYLFGNLAAGSYVVGFSSIPGNLSFTKQNTPGDNGNNTNSDADPITGKTATIILTAGETDLTIDAGLKPDNFASVGDFVWNDLDALGSQSLTEPGVPGILVTLYDATTNLPVGTAITDGNGKYLISKIPVATAGTSFYIIFSNLPAGALFTAQTDNVTPGDITLGSDANTATGRTSNFTLTPGQYLPTVDAGIKNVQVVPVKITSFTAIPKDSQVNLQWKVSEQTNVATYEVEASIDGRTFTTIATVSSNGNQGATYDAVHTAPIVGINYYRIKTVEKDGTISYSEIRKVNFGKGGEVVIYPNPVQTGVINITLTGNMIGKSATVSILSMDGKLISQLQIANTNQTETIDVSRLASGSYVVRLITNTEVVNKTIQVMR
jgi:hypothetical protein